MAQRRPPTAPSVEIGELAIGPAVQPFAQHWVLREYRQAIEDAEARLERLTRQVAEVVSSWSMAPVVEAYQALGGVALLAAVTFAATRPARLRLRWYEGELSIR